MKDANPDSVDADRPKRGARAKRLDPERREEEIVAGAVTYFSEVGFDGSMRDLAARLGISHSLLFRYFPTKNALVDRVYDRIFLGRWDPSWDDVLTERDTDIAKRLKRFYREYLAAIDRPEWARTFVYAGLAGVNINQRYLTLISRKVIEPIAMELERLSGGDGVGTPSEAAVDLSWGLHGEIFYLAIRRWVYGIDIQTDRERFVALTVEKFLSGAPAALSASRKTADRD